MIWRSVDEPYTSVLDHIFTGLANTQLRDAHYACAGEMIYINLNVLFVNCKFAKTHPCFTKGEIFALNILFYEFTWIYDFFCDAHHLYGQP